MNALFLKHLKYSTFKWIPQLYSNSIQQCTMRWFVELIAVFLPYPPPASYMPPWGPCYAISSVLWLSCFVSLLRSNNSCFRMLATVYKKYFSNAQHLEFCLLIILVLCPKVYSFCLDQVLWKHVYECVETVLEGD